MKNSETVITKSSKSRTRLLWYFRTWAEENFVELRRTRNSTQPKEEFIAGLERFFLMGCMDQKLEQHFKDWMKQRCHDGK